MPQRTIGPGVRDTHDAWADRFGGYPGTVSDGKSAAAYALLLVRGGLPPG